MVPNFHDDLNLQNNSRAVAAGGPCNWEPDDAWAEINNVTIEQGAVVATSGAASLTVQNGRDRDWWLNVSSSSQFTRGPALARATAIVHRTDGGTYEYPWAENAQLH
jgi:hypothetical protein